MFTISSKHQQNFVDVDWLDVYSGEAECAGSETCFSVPPLSVCDISFCAVMSFHDSGRARGIKAGLERFDKGGEKSRENVRLLSPLPGYQPLVSSGF